MGMMEHHAALLSFLVLGAACGSNSSQLSASPSVPSATSPSSDGTLVARLSWPPSQGRLELWLADTLSSQVEQPPIAGKVELVSCLMC